MPGAASLAAAAAAAKADISELEQANVVGRRIADRSFINQLNHRYGGPTSHAPRMAERVTEDRARRHAEIDQLRRNRSVSAIDSDYRAQLSAIVGELWQPERQRSATQTQANRPTSAAGAPAARLRRLVANGPLRGAARRPSTQHQESEESGAREEAASQPNADPEREGAVDAVVRRLINHERQREISMLEKQRSVAVLLNSAFRADLEQLIQVQPDVHCACAMPHLEPEAPCPMPYARSPMPEARCPMPKPKPKLVQVHCELAAHGVFLDLRRTDLRGTPLPTTGAPSAEAPGARSPPRRHASEPGGGAAEAAAEAIAARVLAGIEPRLERLEATLTGEVASMRQLLQASFSLGLSLQEQQARTAAALCTLSQQLQQQSPPQQQQPQQPQPQQWEQGPPPGAPPPRESRREAQGASQGQRQAPPEAQTQMQMLAQMQRQAQAQIQMQAEAQAEAQAQMQAQMQMQMQPLLRLQARMQATLQRRPPPPPPELPFTGRDPVPITRSRMAECAAPHTEAAVAGRGPCGAGSEWRVGRVEVAPGASAEELIALLLASLPAAIPGTASGDTLPPLAATMPRRAAPSAANSRQAVASRRVRRRRMRQLAVAARSSAEAFDTEVAREDGPANPTPGASDAAGSSRDGRNPRPVPSRSASECNPPASSTCSVCYDRPADAVLYRCGHQCACMQCAYYMRHERLGCPLCRAPIEDVVRVYK